MERVAETAELLGVEASIGTSKLEIGHATKDFIAGVSVIQDSDSNMMLGACAGADAIKAAAAVGAVSLVSMMAPHSCPATTQQQSLLDCYIDILMST